MLQLLFASFVTLAFAFACVPKLSGSKKDKNDKASVATEKPVLLPPESSDLTKFKKRLMPIEKLFDQKSPYIKTMTVSMSLLSQSYDLSRNDSPVRDQGDRGTCTAFGLLATIENMISVQYSKKFDLSEEQLWSVYNQGDTDFAFWAASNLKITTEDAWPYGNKAPVNLGVGVVSLTSVTQLDEKGVLNGIANLGFPVMFVTQVTKAWQSVKSDGIIDANDNDLLGAHAMALVGIMIDSSAPGGGWYKIKNSWSELWGDKGYGYLPLNYCEKFKCQAWGISYQHY